jgi:hypothetical protein
VSGNEAIGSHLLSISLLRLRVRDGGNVGAESLGEEETCRNAAVEGGKVLGTVLRRTKGRKERLAEVAESTDADDSDVLSRLTGTTPDKRGVHRGSSAEHRGGDGRVEPSGDLHNEVAGSAVVAGVCRATEGQYRSDGE